jgi:hypothetical protein
MSFLSLVFGTLQGEGLYKKGMSTDEAIEIFNKLQGGNSKSFPDKKEAEEKEQYEKLNNGKSEFNNSENKVADKIKSFVDLYGIKLIKHNEKDAIQATKTSSIKNMEHFLNLIEQAGGKDNIIDYLKNELSEKEKLKKEREDKIKSIEGLTEISNAINENATARYKFNKSFENEYTSSFATLPKPIDVKALKEKYPRAAAYLKAEAYENSDNIDKYSAGKKAKERIINGEDYNQVIKDMENEWDHKPYNWD